MSLIEAIILGLIQGLTEFIPISSTAHLTLAGKLMGLIDPNNPEKWTAFMAIIQLGTIVAVMFYFRNEIFDITRDFLKENISKRTKFKEQSLNSRLGWYVILGSIPIVAIGLLIKKVIEGNITKDPLVIAISMITLAVILYFAEKKGNFTKDEEHISLKDAVLIGIAQCFALFPGASRSGTTITAGLFLGLKRDTAAKFSFLLSIPAILGSGLLEFKSAIAYLTPDEFLTLGIATLVSGISGYLSIAFLLKFLKNNTTILFINYRIIVGLILLILIFNNII